MIDLDEITESFEFFDEWEDKYKFIVDLGKKLPLLREEDQVEENLVPGCQSQVWLVSHYNPSTDLLQFDIDSDAHIVRGLIGIIQAAYSDRSPQQILDFDIEGLFEQLDLLAHLVPTRGNGLRAMVQRIRAEAQLHSGD